MACPHAGAGGSKRANSETRGRLTGFLREKVGEGRCIVISFNVSLLPHSWPVLERPLVNFTPLGYTFSIPKDQGTVMMLVVGHSGCPGGTPTEGHLSPGRLRAEWSWVCTLSQEGSPGSGWCWRFCVHSLL